MAANSELNCVTCQLQLSLEQGFKIHKCLACYCKTCSNIPDCVSCKMNIFDADFIHFDKLESCHFYNECKSRATMKCSCINKAICGQHLINIHADVPGKKCEPETLHGNYMGIMCSKCNKLFARYVNRNNQQEICVSCFHDANSNDFVPKDLLTYENFKSKLKLINNALDKNIEMNKTRVVEFENSMKQKKKITDEALNRLLKLNNQCNHENMEKHIQMKSLNSEAVVAANKIKNLNMNDILIQAARNKQIDINVTLDKWQTWMKDRVRKLENPSVSCISIEFREDQGTSVAHKIIVRQEQHLGTCNFESCDPDNNMIIAGDDKTQDAISNGPCETEQELPRKRLKVRKGKVCRRRVIRNGGNKPQPLPLQPNPAPQLPFNRGFVEHVRERLASPQPQPSALVPPQSPQSQQRPTIDDMIERLAQQQARERVNVEHGSVNGGNKVRLKLSKPSIPIKEEPLEPNDASDVQAKSGPDNTTEEDICALCVRIKPVGHSGTCSIDWIACDFCPKWFHQTCVVMPPGFNKKRDKFKCDSCKKKTH